MTIHPSRVNIQELRETTVLFIFSHVFSFKQQSASPLQASEKNTKQIAQLFGVHTSLNGNL